MQITNRTVSFREGQAVSDHDIFEDENGVEFIAEPGPVQRWLRLDEVKRPRHDRVKFLQDAERSTGLRTEPEVMTAAYAHTSQQQRVVNPKPLKIQVPLSKTSPLEEPKFALVDNK